VVWKDHAVLPFTSIATNSGSYIRALFPGVDVRAYSHELQTISKGIVITTDGGDPIHVIDRDGSAFVVSPPKTDVKDATGAGDAFRAGLLYGLTKGRTLMESVCLGVATGSLKVKYLGAATTLPEISEILQLAETITVERI
jgi:sugar/nucleoside kinase (ribokinase family)